MDPFDETVEITLEFAQDIGLVPKPLCKSPSLLWKLVGKYEEKLQESSVERTKQIQQIHRAFCVDNLMVPTTRERVRRAMKMKELGL